LIEDLTDAVRLRGAFWRADQSDLSINPFSSSI